MAWSQGPALPCAAEEPKAHGRPREAAADVRRAEQWFANLCGTLGVDAPTTTRIPECSTTLTLSASGTFNGSYLGDRNPNLLIYRFRANVFGTLTETTLSFTQFYDLGEFVESLGASVNTLYQQQTNGTRNP